MMEQLQSIFLPICLFVIPASMAVILIFRNSIIKRLGRDNFPENIKFEDKELVITPAKPLRRTILLGSVLYVPQGVNAVVAGASINLRRLYEPGEHIITDLRHAVLFYKYVDITRRHLTIKVDDAPTKDGFKISLWVNLSFRVVDPMMVANIDQPVLDLIAMIENAIRSTTHLFSHDEIVPTPQVQSVSNGELVYEIRKELIYEVYGEFKEPINEIVIFRSIILSSIYIKSRLADPNRLYLTGRPPEAGQDGENTEKPKEKTGTEKASDKVESNEKAEPKSENKKIQLRRQLKIYFNEAEFKNDLLYHLDIGNEDLAGSTYIDKLTSLIGYLERRGRIEELIKLCEKIRPNTSWDMFH